jgi:hypothetical protein
MRRTALLLVLVLMACSSGGSPPIGEQNCQQLAHTFSSIQHSLRPDASFSEQSRATRDAGDLNRRVDELGGCPDEPSLQ